MRRDQRGQVTLFMLGMVPVILFFIGLALDLWRAVGADRAVATAVDAAAAAGASALDEAAFRADETIRLDPGRARALAEDALARQPEAPTLTGVSIVVTDETVTVEARMNVNLTLVRVLSPEESIEVHATSTARPRRSP